MIILNKTEPPKVSGYVAQKGGHSVETLKMFEPVEIGKDVLSVNVDLDEYFFLKQWQHRLIGLNDDIDEVTAGALVKTIMHINLLDKGLPKEDRVPIKLFLSSDGGDVVEGLALIDIIQNSVTPVYTINTSHQYSMAAIVGLVGHKRYAMKNSTFLLHDGTTVTGDSSGKVHDFIKFDTQVRERMKEIVTSNTSITSRVYNKKLREEWYFFADEAKKLGVIDGIIGEDVTLEEII